MDWLYLNLLLDSICWSLLIPTLPGIHTSIGISNIAVGSISSLVSTVTFLTGTVQGSIADRIGRFTMLRLSLLSQIVGHLILLLSLRTKSFYLFVLGRVIQACCKSGMVVSQALLHDLSHNDSLQNLGKLIACSNIAYIIGPMLGGQLYIYNELLPSRLAALVALGALGILHIAEQTVEKEYSYTDKSLTRKLSSNNISANTDMNRHSTISTSKSISDSATGASTLTSLQSAPIYHFLHLKFAFQIGNSLFEALLPQYSAMTLGLTSRSIGGILSYAGLLSVLSNIYILPALPRGHLLDVLLVILVLALGLGLTLWALARDLFVLLTAVSIISVASNLFLSIVQGMLSAAQRLQEGSSTVTTGSGSSSGKTSNTITSDDPPLPKAFCEYSSEEEDIHTTTISSSTTIRSVSSRVTTTTASTNAKSGAVYGLSSTADRAARILSPILGTVLLEQFGSMGLVYIAVSTLVYCLVLLSMYMSISWTDLVEIGTTTYAGIYGRIRSVYIDRHHQKED
jgi:MFS family permease